MRVDCRQRHTTTANHPARTAEPDTAHQQHGGTSVCRQWRPCADRPLVQERAPADARRTSLSAA